MSKRYFLANGTNTSASGLRKLAETGQLSPNDPVRIEGMSKWVPVSRLKGLFPERAVPILFAEPIEEAETFPEAEPVLEAIPVLEPVDAVLESATAARSHIGGLKSSKVQERRAAAPALVSVDAAIPVATLAPLSASAVEDDVATALPVCVAEPVVQAEQPKGVIDRLCSWLADKVQEHTGIEVSPKTVKIVGGVALATVAVKVAADVVASGSPSGSGMGRHETRATEQMMAAQNTINAGGTVTWY